MKKQGYLLIGITATLAIAGCSGIKPASLNAVQGDHIAAGAPAVRSDVLTYSGKLSGLSETNIYSRTAGRVASVSKDIGDAVSPGDTLISLETTDLQAQLESAEADLELARAKYNETKRGSREEDIRSANAAYVQAYQRYVDTKNGKRPEEIAKLKAALDEAQSSYNAAKDKYSRTLALYNQGAAPKQGLDDAGVALHQVESKFLNAKDDLTLAEDGPTAATLQSLKAAADQMKAQLDKAKNGPTPELVSQSAAGVAKAEALVHLNEYNVNNGVIKSPVKGYVAVKSINAGEMVNPSVPLMTIVDLTKVYLSVSVPDSELKYFTPGEQVNVRVDGIGKTVEGTVHTISPKSDAGTNKFTVKIIMDNRDLQLKSGMTGILNMAKK